MERHHTCGDLYACPLTFSRSGRPIPFLNSDESVIGIFMDPKNLHEMMVQVLWFRMKRFSFEARAHTQHLLTAIRLVLSNREMVEIGLQRRILTRFRIRCHGLTRYGMLGAILLFCRLPVNAVCGYCPVGCMMNWHPPRN